MKTLTNIVTLLYAGMAMAATPTDMVSPFGTFTGSGSAFCSAPGCNPAACQSVLSRWQKKMAEDKKYADGVYNTEQITMMSLVNGGNDGRAHASESRQAANGAAMKAGKGKQNAVSTGLQKVAAECTKDIEANCKPPVQGYETTLNECKNISNKAGQVAGNTGKDAAAGGGMGEAAQGLMGALGAMAPMLAQMMQKKDEPKEEKQKPTEYAATSTSLGGGVSGTNGGSAASVKAPVAPDAGFEVKDYGNSPYTSSLTADEKDASRYNGEMGNTASGSMGVPSAGDGGGGGGAFGSSGASVGDLAGKGAGAGDAGKKGEFGNFDMPSLGGGSGRFLGLKGGSSGSSSLLGEEENAEGAAGVEDGLSDDPFAESDRSLASADGELDPAAEGGSLFKVVGHKIKEMKRRGNI